MINTGRRDPLDAALGALEAIGVRSSQVASSPRPLFVVDWVGNWRDRAFDDSIGDFVRLLAGQVADDSDWPQLRCVSIDQLPSILARGCDVQPSDAVLWVDPHTDKMFEYGEETKAMMVFHEKLLEQSHQLVPATITPEQLAELKKTYPTVIPSVDGEVLWLTRLSFEDRRATTPYEVEHGRWIPGDPWKALLAVVVFGRNHETVRGQVEAAIAACETPKWTQR
jgi:hypothetical protein